MCIFQPSQWDLFQIPIWSVPKPTFGDSFLLHTERGHLENGGFYHTQECECPTVIRSGNLKSFASSRWPPENLWADSPCLLAKEEPWESSAVSGGTSASYNLSPKGLYMVLDISCWFLLKWQEVTGHSVLWTNSHRLAVSHTDFSQTKAAEI